MSTSFELDPVTRIATGAVGEPGDRVFYLQARSADQFVTLLVEKEQVRALAVSIEQMLEQLPDPREPEIAVPPEDAELEDPLLAEWRVGPMALHYDEAVDRIVLIASEAIPLPEDPDEEPDPLVEPDPGADVATARFVATRAQMRALGDHAEEVVDAGRPRCRFCGNPMDASGHVCPAMNGHREA
jgi:uncharacterized repeat protein (TIGR03847 family)